MEMRSRLLSYEIRDYRLVEGGEESLMQEVNE